MIKFVLMMKYIFSTITIALLACTTSFCQIGAICKWDNDRSAAVVLTFDDWTPGQYPVAAPDLKSRNLTGTFFPVLSNIGPWNHDWPDLATMVSSGNEMGNHGEFKGLSLQMLFKTI
jgi:peptidoglycan/xylan/chitin deacetylase (PgdA/CDA1 family)